MSSCIYLMGLNEHHLWKAVNHAISNHTNDFYLRFAPNKSLVALIVSSRLLELNIFIEHKEDSAVSTKFYPLFVINHGDVYSPTI